MAANFTSAYGLWLARSGFSTQALRTVLGRAGGIETPHVFLLQPYDPNRRVIVILHGLASSPEAWINVANEVLGDERLRSRYQIWQVHYPTNLPLAYNNAEIRAALRATFHHFDPTGAAAASNNVVVIGHSMGGVLVVPYHSIIANDTPDKALIDSDDGLVPYRSSHLDGAASELVIPFSHSVQETPEAILEIRRILREQ